MSYWNSETHREGLLRFFLETGRDVSKANIARLFWVLLTHVFIYSYEEALGYKTDIRRKDLK